jgi:hypothetical protein
MEAPERAELSRSGGKMWQFQSFQPVAFLNNRTAFFERDQIYRRPENGLESVGSPTLLKALCCNMLR